MSDFAAEFELYLQELEHAGWRSRSHLVAGVDRSEASQVLGAYSGQSVEALYTWFGAVNGMRSASKLGQMWLIPLFVPMSASDSFQAYQGLIEAGLWSPSWVPILEDQAGWFHAIDVGSPSGQVVFAQLDMGLTPVVFATLEDMIRTHRVAVARGLVVFTEDGIMRADEARLAELSRELNPGIDWWK